ncbi:MAG TPA: SRPBCC family protein [Spirochaetia bacterium]|nr:SRPBCC family protein [Spirochaetia bacterium]
MARGFTARAEIVILAPAERVWEALVTPALIKEYLFGTEASSDWRVGSAITYRGVWQGKPYEDKGVIEELVPNARYQSTYWSPMSGTPDLPENYSTVTWELEGAPGGTLLRVSQDNNPTEESASHSKGNWEMVLGKIKELLERG